MNEASRTSCFRSDGTARAVPSEPKTLWAIAHSAVSVTRGCWQSACNASPGNAHWRTRFPSEEPAWINLKRATRGPGKPGKSVRHSRVALCTGALSSVLVDSPTGGTTCLGSIVGCRTPEWVQGKSTGAYSAGGAGRGRSNRNSTDERCAVLCHAERSDLARSMLATSMAITSPGNSPGRRCSLATNLRAASAREASSVTWPSIQERASPLPGGSSQSRSAAMRVSRCGRRSRSR